MNLKRLKKKKTIMNDFWDFLSDWEKDDIQAGISDLENGRFKNIEEVLSKY